MVNSYILQRQWNVKLKLMQIQEKPEAQNKQNQNVWERKMYSSKQISPMQTFPQEHIHKARLSLNPLIVNVL